MAPPAAVPAAPAYKVPDLGVVAIGIAAALAVTAAAGYFALVPLAIPVWIAAGITLFVIVGNRHRARKVHAFRVLCARRGWTFQEQAPPQFVPSFGIIGPFGRGHGRTASMLVSGPGGFQAFQYTYYTKSGGRKRDSRRYHHFCVASLTMPLAVPSLRVKRERLGHKIVEALGGEDIDFEDDTFSREWWVQCKDRRLAYDILHPAAMAFVQGLSPPLAWEWDGNRLVAFCSGRLHPDDAERLHEGITGFASLLPRHLRRRPGGAARPPVQAPSSPTTHGSLRGP